MENSNTLSEIRNELQTIMVKANLLSKECSDSQTKFLHETSAEVLRCLISAYSQAEGNCEEQSL
jgi:hypothetical protein